jgi:hypothetical protein
LNFLSITKCRRRCKRQEEIEHAPACERMAPTFFENKEGAIERASRTRGAGSPLVRGRGGPVSADEEDALYEEVLDLYSREVDGILAGPPELRNVAGCRALVNLGRGIHLSDPDQSAACVVCADLLASRLRPGELGVRELISSWVSAGELDLLSSQAQGPQVGVRAAGELPHARTPAAANRLATKGGRPSLLRS